MSGCMNLHPVFHNLKVGQLEGGMTCQWPCGHQRWSRSFQVRVESESESESGVRVGVREWDYHSQSRVCDDDHDRVAAYITISTICTLFKIHCGFMLLWDSLAFIYLLESVNVFDEKSSSPHPKPNCEAIPVNAAGFVHPLDALGMEVFHPSNALGMAVFHPPIFGAGSDLKVSVHLTSFLACLSNPGLMIVPLNSLTLSKTANIQ